MSREICWTCDKCQYTERSELMEKPKGRDFFTVSVVVVGHTTYGGTKHQPTAEVMWCKQCCAKARVAPVVVKTGEERPKPPTIEDIIYDMVGEAVEGAMDR